MPNLPTESALRFSLAGYRGRTDDGVAQVIHFGRTARLRRGGRVLATCWGLALAGAFIPVAHFLLVPGFVIGGVVAAGRRFYQHERVQSASGTCPDCQANQRFEIEGGWTLPGHLTCAKCSRALTAVPLDPPPSS